MSDQRFCVWCEHEGRGRVTAECELYSAVIDMYLELPPMKPKMVDLCKPCYVRIQIAGGPDYDMITIVHLLELQRRIAYLALDIGGTIAQAIKTDDLNIKPQLSLFHKQLGDEIERLRFLLDGQAE